MVHRPPPGTLRPQGRTERVRQAVVSATRGLLAADGYDALTIERVADAAGVAKSTVYRRWRDTAGLMMELMREVAGAAIPLADSGSVDEDLRVLAIEIVKFFSGTSGAMVLALVAESVHNPDTAAGMREFWAERNERAAIAVRRGIDRGELPSEVDPVEVIRALGAPLYYRMLVTHEPLDDVVAARAAAAALAAARAGTLSRSD